MNAAATDGTSSRGSSAPPTQCSAGDGVRLIDCHSTVNTSGPTASTGSAISASATPRPRCTAHQLATAAATIANTHKPWSGAMNDQSIPGGESARGNDRQ